MKQIVCIFFLFSCLFIFNVSAQSSPLIISEVQPSNQYTFTDEDGNHEDWIELHNTTNQPLDLTGWTISDVATNSKQWTMTGGTLAANGYLIVFASDKNRRTPGSNLHTNFKLNATGDYLALYDPTGAKVQEFNQLPRVETDFSYSFYQGSWYYTTEPTPGTANTLNGIFQNPAPVFSVQHGLFNASFNLDISCGQSDANIYYTLDGSVPSATNGNLYQQALPVEKTSIVRAIAISNPLSDSPLLESAITTQSYLFPNDIIHQSNTPAGYPAKWGKYATNPDTAIADYEMDPKLISDPAFAEKVKASFYDLPIVSLVTDLNHFFNKKSDPVTGGIYIFTEPNYNDKTTPFPWERPLSLELIEPAKGVSLQVDCGVQLHGGASRWPEKSPKHSLRIDFRSEYGIGKLRYPLIGDAGPKVINSFFLRAGFSDTWLHWSTYEQIHATYARDTWAKLTQLRMNNQGSHTIYAHLFINGIYWGLYDPIERLDDNTFAYWYGGDKEDWDVIKDGGVSDGNNIAWNRLKRSVLDSISGTSMDSDVVLYQKIQGLNVDGSENVNYPKLLDVDNYIDYMLINLYGTNTDWDGHNWVVARNRVNPGLGFRFFCWDTENIIDGTGTNYLSRIDGDLTKMFQKLRTVAPFRKRFADRAQIHLYDNGWLTASKAIQTFSDLTVPIERSLYAESARWGDYRRDVQGDGNPQLYREDVQFKAERNNILTDYFPKRSPIFVQQLKDADLLYPVDRPYFTMNDRAIVSDTIRPFNKVSIKFLYSNVDPKLNPIIYYTLDNTDPAIWALDSSASPSPTAILYNSVIRPNQSVFIKARAMLNNIWSGLAEQNFVFVGTTALDLTHESIDNFRNYPNPFKNSTTLAYELSSDARVLIEVYDVSGRKMATVINENQSAGIQEVQFDGTALNAGVYICVIQVQGSEKDSKRIRMIKR